MPSNAQELPPIVPPQGNDQETRQERLLSIVPEETRRGYDMIRVIQTIVDDERIFILKPDFDRSVITCLGPYRWSCGRHHSKPAAAYRRSHGTGRL